MTLAVKGRDQYHVPGHHLTEQLLLDRYRQRSAWPKWSPRSRTTYADGPAAVRLDIPAA
jgi:hypothetical protein